MEINEFINKKIKNKEIGFRSNNIDMPILEREKLN